MIHVNNPYRMLVFGGRGYGNFSVAHTEAEKAMVLDQFNFQTECLDRFVATFGPPDKVFEGRAPGADTTAHIWAQARGYKGHSFPADWDRGRSAGMERNKTMLTIMRAFPAFDKVAIGFPGGAGTKHMAEIANLAGVKVFQVEHGVCPW